MRLRIEEYFLPQLEKYSDHFIPVTYIEAYAENDAYWLKFYHFAGKVDTAVFNQLQAEHMEYLKELDELDNS